ncbi:hypothetical protein Ae717Ps2_5237c [Pseudonocardia sp. Ae717_Ps2]|uniref:hypothetical protein n=1 Tax=unclassified Pseudonocardia TaxID=2619320 RepID=UPI00094B3549|nr:MULTISPECIES: hypothetical protein [unclassified Pseudonocardia]OLM11230.1 hypothetical protein Ae505Ps2_1353c [Pseudonocardia sp. Ae505_Ps2]OLM34341.1 hypothetical protein Ae717Ps2_5237c [Pseudonocardia sp. Ae717_Ps2]
MTPPVPPLRRSLRALLFAVLTALAIPVALAAGAALPLAAVVAGIVLAVVVAGVARTLSWVAGEPIGERATVLAVASGLGAGIAAITLGVVAVFAGPAVLVLVPLLTGAGMVTWWVARRDVPPAL